ncbi:hypothetical protein [Haliangium ochraceum]|uniref:Uncharacterized protein n=1 Tax=Haliangium ochraceum (strain DSM 14365 / JCM 11303 / SMP-2) TaxID=502025 RepID=D0LVX3_HALO1|nr:hypothetical protein [Haliangium ochraceum]ACY14107.1 hypothetical protein Hoch_1555 [Haliangium ochraceum DSM 14365]
MPVYWNELQPLLERFWGTPLCVEFAEPDLLPRISCEVANSATARMTADPRALSRASAPSAAVLFTTDIDSLAAVSRHLNSEEAPPLLVLGDTIATLAARSDDVFTKLFAACSDRLATITVCAPRGQSGAGGLESSVFPEDWRVLHALAAALVALACDIGELQIPQNGVRNLNLPITAAALARSVQSIDPEFARILSHTLSRMAHSTIEIRNPLLTDTPSELVANLVEPGSGRLGVNIDTLCRLIENDNTYEERVDHHISILGALKAGALLTEQHEVVLMSELLLPTNLGLADDYVRSIRELPAMSDLDVLSHLHERSVGTATGAQQALAVGLLRRHAESVRRVLARAIQRFAHDVVAGTLADSCLLMRAASPGLPHERTDEGRKPVFRRLGERSDCWEIWFEGGEPVYVKDRKGLGYIHLLLQSQGSTFSAANLRDAVAGHGQMPIGNLGPLADTQAIRLYQRRLEALRVDFDIAEEHNDIGRKERILYEIDAIEQELRRTIGLGGRLRQNSDAERARKSVSNAIHRALQELRGQHPRLARHLSASLKIGNGVAYLPDSDTEWETA